MRKVTICFLLMLCSVWALGQQPQWIVVQNVVLFNQTTPIPLTTLLTPTEPGEYRLNAYFSGLGSGSDRNSNSGELDIVGTDLTGAPMSNSLGLSCAQPIFSSLPTMTMILKPQVPLVYSVRLGGTGVCKYNLAITIEQLVEQ